jgi:hypothetical protein
MKLTDDHIKAIKEAALDIEYGSVAINIADGKVMEIVTHTRLRIPRDSENGERLSPEKRERGHGRKIHPR